ncbi:hypothetical protein EV383_5399 [Pseudonocardia sediminis]|uniref:Uncharacterized protein n=1 Tax=Pseudonocardia sediminis TaxID=1397368 RepID=A0A4Q7V1R1_PSEST|nr:MarR family transcriptional regulator [Pseudonocardia sediminis]RZT88457.1 hypothetical protein EV383_5399 [Pseudonocardia sediminis]
MTGETTRQGTDPTLLVLHTLRLSGFVAVDTVAERTGLDAAAVTAELDVAAAAGRAKERTGRISGWMLTPDGRAEHARLLAAELDATGARTEVERAEEAFLELNLPFKEICSRWQLLPDGSSNDHSDTAYDDAMIAELGGLHPRAVALTDGLAGALPRFARYAPALTGALTRLRGGDPKAFAAPLSSSYHDVWMELHQDLMSTLGRERTAADGH